MSESDERLVIIILLIIGIYFVIGFIYGILRYKYFNDYIGDGIIGYYDTPIHINIMMSLTMWVFIIPFDIYNNKDKLTVLVKNIFIPDYIVGKKYSNNYKIKHYDEICHALQTERKKYEKQILRLEKL